MTAAPTRPHPPRVAAARVPAALKAIPRWVTWRYRWNETRWTKPPLTAGGKAASSTDPKTWTTFERALAAYEEGKLELDGVGLVLTDQTDVIAWDLDHCLDKNLTITSATARRLVENLASYTEITPSGAGLRIFVRAKLRGVTKRKLGDVEIFQAGQYATVTGQHWPGSPLVLRECQRENDLEFTRVFGGGDPEARLLQKVAADPTMARYFDVGVTKEEDHSGVDLDFCRFLAKLGASAPQIDSLVRRSKLFRKKWDEIHHTEEPRRYGERTILKALQRAPKPDELEVVGRTYAEIVPEKIQWLWPGHLPLAKLVVFEGPPGLGKSTLSLYLAATLSTAGTFPDGYRAELSSTVVMTGEDNPEDTVRPRLDAAGANPRLVHSLDAVIGKGDERLADLALDVARIERYLLKHEARLLIVDPLFSFLGVQVDSYTDQHIRRVFGPLSAMAARARCTVLMIRHPVKNAVGPAIYRGGGSIGIIAAARSGFAVGIDPEDPTKRLLAPVKMNIARMPPTRRFSLENPPGNPDVAYVRWEGTSAKTAEDLGLLIKPRDRQQSELDRATEFLLEALEGGPRFNRELQAEVQGRGISSWATVRRAAALLKVKITQAKDGWVWALEGGL